MGRHAITFDELAATDPWRFNMIAGFLPAYWRRPAEGWLELHFQFMTWSYIGLLAAVASEIAVRIPKSPFWWAVIVSSAVIIMAGAFILAHARPKLLTRYGRASRT